MGKKHGIFIALFVMALLMAGCGNEGRLDEGDCPVEVRLAGLPTGYAELTDDQKEQVVVNLQLENMINEKTYTFRLNDDNHFSQEASLNPGTYRVAYCYISGSSAVRMNGEASVETMDINRDTINIISVSVTNQEEFDQWVAQMRADAAILRADQFSRIIQFEGQIINMEQILNYVEFTHDQQVRAYDKVVLDNGEKGVHVTVLNDTGEPADWWNCKVIAVRFTKDNVIFGKGARVRMPAEEILHAKDGLYGTPDSLAGCVLIGADYADFDAIYHETRSGDRMTFTVDSFGEHITEITYEFAVFE